MDKMIGLYKKHYELINYACITLLLVLACFFSAAIYVLVAVVCACACFYKNDKLVTLYCVSFLIKKLLVPMFLPYIHMIFALMFFKNYLLNVIKSKKSCHIKVLALFLCLILYAVIMHFVAPYTETITLVRFICDIMIVYFVFEAREEINLVRLVKVFAGFVVVTGIICYISKYGKTLQEENITFVQLGVWKLFGLTENPNAYGFAVIFSMIALMWLFFLQKIDQADFVLLFIPNFVCGYLTVSRNFALTAIIALVLFGLCYLAKYKLQALELLLPLCAICLTVCLIFEAQTLFYIGKYEWTKNIIDSSSTSVFSSYSLTYEDLLLYFQGKLGRDIGRIGIWQVYLIRIFSSPAFIWFGLGASSIWLGIFPHSTIIMLLYKFGIVGIVLVSLCTSMMIKEGNKGLAKTQPVNILYYLLIAIVPCLVMFIFDWWPVLSVGVIFMILETSCFRKLAVQIKSDLAEREAMQKMLIKKPSKIF